MWRVWAHIWCVELGHELVLVQMYFCHHHHQHYPIVLDWRLWTPGLGMTNGRRDVTRSKAQRAWLVYSRLPDRITYLLMYHIMTLVGLEEYNCNWRWIDITIIGIGFKRLLRRLFSG